MSDPTFTELGLILRMSWPITHKPWETPSSELFDYLNELNYRLRVIESRIGPKPEAGEQT